MNYEGSNQRGSRRHTVLAEWCQLFKLLLNLFLLMGFLMFPSQSILQNSFFFLSLMRDVFVWLYWFVNIILYVVNQQPPTVNTNGSNAKSNRDSLRRRQETHYYIIKNIETNTNNTHKKNQNWENLIMIFIGEKKSIVVALATFFL